MSPALTLTQETSQTLFNVPLTCEDCIRDISSSLHSLAGINSVTADLKTQLVSIEGTAPPSAIVRAIQETGRDAILRGSGTADSAAVCILESHSPVLDPKISPVRGLIRMVQVAPSLTIMDVTLRGLSPGTYHASIRAAGDISRGPESTGGLWEAVKGTLTNGTNGLRSTNGANGANGTNATNGPTGMKSRALLGTVEVSKGGIGAMFVEKPIEVWEIIGRGIVVSRKDPAQCSDADAGRGNGFDSRDADTIVGVVARSAGVWENEKTVCSCSGKTVWDERVEQKGKGIE